MTFTRKQKVGAGAVAAGLSGLALLGGTYAAFTATAPAPAQKVDSGTVALSLNAANATTAVVANDIANLAAGDAATRFVDVKNTGSIGISGLTLSTTAGATVLLTDTTNGVTLKVESCSTAWNTSTGACDDGDAGTTDTVTAALAATKLSTPLSKAALGVFPATAGSTTKFKMTYLLPSAADNTFQGKADTTTLTFESTQRTAGTFNNTNPTGSANGS